MTPETVKETIQNYRYYFNDYNHLVGSLESTENDSFDLMGMGLSSRDEKVSRRLELLEKKLMIVVEALEYTELTEKEWTVVDWLMEGKSLAWIAREILCLSHTHTVRILLSASKKMSIYIKQNYA